MMLEDCWLRQNNLFTKVKKYPTDGLPSPEAVKLLCKLGGGDGELLQGELLRRPCAPGGVRAPGDLPLREGPPHGFLLLKARAETCAAGCLLEYKPPGNRNKSLKGAPLTEAELGVRTGKKSGTEFNSASN